MGYLLADRPPRVPLGIARSKKEVCYIVYFVQVSSKLTGFHWQSPRIHYAIFTMRRFDP